MSLGGAINIRLNVTETHIHGIDRVGMMHETKITKILTEVQTASVLCHKQSYFARDDE